MMCTSTCNVCVVVLKCVSLNDWMGGGGGERDHQWHEDSE
jgi:hypothetical protein